MKVSVDRLRAWVNEGIRHQQSGALQAAADCYRRALQLDPDYFDALQLLGVTQFRSGELMAGIDLLQRALRLEPDHAPTLNNLGNALRAAGRWHEAIAAYRRAVAMCGTQPHPMMVRNLGSALLEIGEYTEAERMLAFAVSLNDRDAELHCWIGHLARVLGRPADAASAYRKSIALQPSLLDGYRGLGSALRDLGQLEAALDAYNSAVRLGPDVVIPRVLRTNLALSLCSWQDWESDRQVIMAAVPSTVSAVDPFTLFYLTDSRAVLRRYADAFAEQSLAQAPRLPEKRRPRSDSQRIRVAYLSGDLRDHPVAHLTAGIFGRHDRKRFDVRVYSIEDEAGEPLRKRIADSCERFVPLGAVSDSQLAWRLRADENDILVDLMGYTQRGLPRVLAARPVPVQVGWLGYPGTLGGSFMDYLLADEFIVPPGAEDGYSEQIVRLPDTFQPNDSERAVGVERSRAAYGLPEAAVVLCSFNHAQKINPLLFQAWMNVLRSVPDAVLWLGVRTAAALENLRLAAAAQGVDAGRLIFAERVPANADHLARYRVADLALDTFPYGSHTTASDALWAGCPLVAVVGESIAARVSGSILRAAGFPELVTESLDSYQNLVVTLATDRNRLQSLRQRLVGNRHTCALFDTARFVRSLEAAYTLMYQRAVADLPPTHLRVAGDESHQSQPRLSP